MIKWVLVTKTKFRCTRSAIVLIDSVRKNTATLATSLLIVLPKNASGQSFSLRPLKPPGLSSSGSCAPLTGRNRNAARVFQIEILLRRTEGCKNCVAFFHRCGQFTLMRCRVFHWLLIQLSRTSP